METLRGQHAQELARAPSSDYAPLRRAQPEHAAERRHVANAAARRVDEEHRVGAQLARRGRASLAVSLMRPASPVRSVRSAPSRPRPYTLARVRPVTRRDHTAPPSSTVAPVLPTRTPSAPVIDTELAVLISAPALSTTIEPPITLTPSPNVADPDAIELIDSERAVPSAAPPSVTIAPYPHAQEGLARPCQAAAPAEGPGGTEANLPGAGARGAAAKGSEAFRVHR